MMNNIKGVPTEARLFGGLFMHRYMRTVTHYRVIVYPQKVKPTPSVKIVWY